MKIRLLGIIALAAAYLIPSIGSAQGVAKRETGMEFGVDVLYQLTTTSHFDGGSKIKTDDDIGAALYFGYRFNPTA